MKIYAKPIAYFGLFYLLLLFACQKQPQLNGINFYHWKTHLQFSEIEQKYLEKLAVKKIYAKFFDVDWDGQKAVPKALIELDRGLTIIQRLRLEIIPTVFITNRTLQNLSLTEMSDLATRIMGKINQINNKHDLVIHEIQIDCDWSLSTKERYFSLLTHLKNHQKDLKLSVTIRLHQVKFPEKTGLPPADKGVLMYYNMGDVEDWNTENSIIDSEIGQQYIAKLPAYPLPLDLALPIFQWGVLFRDGRMIRLINDLHAEAVADTSRFQKIDKHRFEVLKSTYLHGHYLYQKDQLRLETVQEEDLDLAKEQLFPKMNQAAFELIFYHLDEQNLSKFELAQ